MKDRTRILIGLGIGMVIFFLFFETFPIINTILMFPMFLLYGYLIELMIELVIVNAKASREMIKQIHEEENSITQK